MDKDTQNLIDFYSEIPNGFLCLGTALGAVREGTFIKNQMFDIDTGVMSEDFEWDIVNRLIRKGFNLELVLGKRNYGLSLHFVKDNVHFDLLVFYREKNKVWRITWFKNQKLKHEFEPFEIGVAKINDVEFRSLTESYLEQYYGKEWRIPIEDFNWWDFPPSIKRKTIDIDSKENIYMKKFDE